jgi:hypothetical protein
MMIKLEKIFELTDPFISAASGLVVHDNKIFVVSDDENFIGIYKFENQAGQKSILFKEVLPVDKLMRKKQKGDFEALVHLTHLKKLLVVPSGSTTNRMRGALLLENGDFAQEINFAPLYKILAEKIQEINIEGAIAVDQELWLFQRGNGVANKNALIFLNLADFLHDRPLYPRIFDISLGMLHQVPLSFTDATQAEHLILFLAVAEDSQSTYLDGTVVGSVLGLMNQSGRILETMTLDTTSKPEGLSYNAVEKCFYLVTDDDNPNHPASLFKGELPEKWYEFFSVL